MGDIIIAHLRSKLLEVPFVEDSQIVIDFDLPWSYDMVSDEAKLEMGLIKTTHLIMTIPGKYCLHARLKVFKDEMCASRTTYSKYC